MFELDLSSGAILAIVAAFQSLVFDYFPPVARWFERLADYQKRQLTAGLGIFFGVSAFAMACQGYWFKTELVCTPQSAVTMVGSILVSVAVGYAFHKQTKPNQELKDKLGI